MGDTVEIRAATIHDAEGIARFNVAMAHETEGLDLDPRTAKQGVRGVFEEPHRGFYVVARAEGRIVASLLVTDEWSDWRDGTFWWIQSVYVEPAYRRRGIFRRLYAYVRDRAEREDGVCGLRLYVESENRSAQTTYAVLGMRQTAYQLWEDAFSD